MPLPLDLSEYDVKRQAEGGSERAQKEAEKKAAEIKEIEIRLDRNIQALELDAAQKCGLI